MDPLGQLESPVKQQVGSFGGIFAALALEKILPYGKIGRKSRQTQKIAAGIFEVDFQGIIIDRLDP